MCDDACSKKVTHDTAAAHAQRQHRMLRFLHMVTLSTCTPSQLSKQLLYYTLNMLAPGHACLQVSTQL
jgi:hypothetical protein